LRRRERELLSTNGRGKFLWPDAPMCILKSVEGKTTQPMHGFHRGFVERITCTAEDFLAHADAIRKAAPIREVTFPEMRQPMGFTSWTELSGPCVVMVAGLPGRMELNRSDYRPPYLDVSKMLFELNFPGITFNLIPSRETADRYG
jgi:hypothetical protein